MRHPGRPKKTEFIECKVPTCTKTATSKGLCLTHYAASRRGALDAETGQWLREPKRISSYSADSICLVQDCSTKPRSRGMCEKHAQQREAGIIDENGNQLRELLPTGRKRERETWVGSTRDGYVLRVAPEEHPAARSDGTILEHRYVMERFLGRYLQEWEIVHHKDGNRSNNTYDNLEIMDGRSRSGREGHPPGSEFDKYVAIQVLIQQPDVPDGLKQWLNYYRFSSPPTQPTIASLS